MKHLSWIVTIPVTLVVVVFALANRGTVELHFWPFPWSPPLPLFAVVLGSLLVGILLGFAIAWLSGGPRRRRARQTADRARELARQLAELQRTRAASPAPAPAAGDGRALAPISGDGRGGSLNPGMAEPVPGRLSGA